MFEFTTLAKLVEQFDAFFIDQFGVLINGAGAFPGAATALKNLKNNGKYNLLLSNSGKRSEPNETRLTKLGFDRADYVQVLTSGEVAHRELSKRLGHSIAKGAHIFIISRDGDHSCIEGLDIVVTPTIADADLIIIAGSEADLYVIDHYKNLLREAARSKVPCWCINPDKVMLTSEGAAFGAGQIATLYEQFGAPVEWFGKPHLTMYQTAFVRLNMAKLPDPKVLCIGDSIEHDIAGGHNAGFKTALVQTGIHSNASLSELQLISAKHGAAPDYILPAFAF